MRLELTTPCLKGRCSNLLSYGPVDSASIALVAVDCQAEQTLDSSSLFQNSTIYSKIHPSPLQETLPYHLTW